jgi:hypothetical protein
MRKDIVALNIDFIFLSAMTLIMLGPESNPQA